jgi:hypothetical protein
MSIPTMTEAMTKEARGWLEVVLTLNDGPQRFQKTLMDAAASDAAGMLTMQRYITLAYAAITVSEQDSHWAGWYHDRALELLRLAMDAAAGIEAERAPAGTN